MTVSWHLHQDQWHLTTSVLIVQRMTPPLVQTVNPTGPVKWKPRAGA